MTPFAAEAHVLQQPEVIAGLLDQGVPALDPLRPIVFTGIGTSLHACRVAAAWTRLVTGGKVRPAAVDAHDLALGEEVTAADQVVVVSHRGTKRYPNEVLAGARAAGAVTVAVTGRGAHEPAADIVVRTCAQEQASTHTVSYTAALTVLGRIVAATYGSTVLADALAAAPEAVRATLDHEVPERAVKALVRAEPAIVTGTGMDAITAAEAALKIKEGTYRWAEGMHTEFALHGTPAVFAPSNTAFLIESSTVDGGRTADLRRLLDRIGVPVLSVGVGPDADLLFTAPNPLVRPLVSVVPFQRLVLLAAAVLGANPDLTHAETEPWAGAIADVRL